jgi:hypothetical protein
MDALGKRNDDCVGLPQLHPSLLVMTVIVDGRDRNWLSALVVERERVLTPDDELVGDVALERHRG